MKAVVVKTTVDLSTGKVLEKKIVEHGIVNEDNYWRPLRRVFYEYLERNGIVCIVDSDEGDSCEDIL
jgi:hypothetical protein